ncbi:MAG TPA: HEAT repeat domain-containing protein, partial [Pyrinomonadaceae bacterium]|nr:HEAT repeat domain-containing protein [Pyrinomonadaceae bacterium]
MSEPETNSLKDLLVTAVSDLRIGHTAAQRAEAAHKLGRAQSRIAVSYLIEALSDSAPEVRNAAVEALGEICDQAAIDPLRSLLDRETSPVVSKAKIRQVIGRIKGDESKKTESSISLPMTDDSSHQKIGKSQGIPSSNL